MGKPPMSWPVLGTTRLANLSSIAATNFNTASTSPGQMAMVSCARQSAVFTRPALQNAVGMWTAWNYTFATRLRAITFVLTPANSRVMVHAMMGDPRLNSLCASTGRIAPIVVRAPPLGPLGNEPEAACAVVVASEIPRLGS